MSIIFVADIHCQNKNPHRTATLDFLKWLLENYKEDIIISGGDIFDKSSIHHDLVDEVVSILKQFKDFRIVAGNHEISSKLGNILKPLRHHNNIIIYYEKTEFEIDEIKFIALPSSESKEKSYEQIQGTWDYSLCHFMPIQESFGNGGIELKFKVNVAHLFAHVHRHREFTDNFGNKVLIGGSVVNYRYGEQDWEKNIYRIDKNGYEKIKVPQFFTYETIEFGQEPSNPNNIINIKNATSWEAVHERYKNCYIREEGIEYIKTDNTIQIENTTFEDSTLKQKFKFFAVDRGLPEEESRVCFEYIDRYENVVEE
jgi:hypothetical protein